MSTDAVSRIPSASDATETETHLLHVFLARGLVAIAWAIGFVAASGSTTSGVGVGAGILLVAYPLIDAVASVIDARSEDGSARQLLLANAGASTVAAVALGVAATGTVGDVLIVFGIWAAVAGGAQLVVVLRRRAALGRQLPLLLADGVSILLGVAFIMAGAGTGEPKLRMLAIYAASGGVEFVIQAWLLARRRMHD